MSTPEIHEFQSNPTAETRSAEGIGTKSTLRQDERHHEILRTDPYYPHTLLRALTMWVVMALSCLGFAALATLVLPNREFGWYYVVMTAFIAAVFTGGQFLLRPFRVGRLEKWGRISRQP